MPVGDPRIGKQVRRIVLDDFAMALEFADVVDDDSSGSGFIVAFTAEARIQLPVFDGTARVVEPTHELLVVGERFEYAIRWRNDINLTRNRVLVGRGCHCWSR